MSHLTARQHHRRDTTSQNRTRSFQSTLTKVASATLCVASCSAFSIHHSRQSSSWFTQSTTTTQSLSSSIDHASSLNWRPSQYSSSVAKRAENVLCTSSSTPSSSRLSAVGRRRLDYDDTDEWNATVAALKMYKAAFGDLKVPARFVVPSLPPWPEAAWSMKLGQRVGQIRQVGRYIKSNETRRAQLEKMGFIWRLRSPSKKDIALDNDIPLDVVVAAVKIYRKENPLAPLDPLDIPLSFTVPNCDPWAESMRGMPLGQRIAAMKDPQYWRKNPNPEGKKQLEALGIDFEEKENAPRHDSRFQKVLDALTTYKKIYGDLLVPQPFTVPDGSSNWPESTWGLRLGARVNGIRSQGTFVATYPERRKLLDDMGFVWNLTGSKKFAGRDSKSKIADDEARETTEAAMETLFGPAFSFDSSDDADEEEDGEDGSSDNWSMDKDEGDEEEAGTDEALENDNDNFDMLSDSEYDDFVEPRTIEDSLNIAAERAMEVGIISNYTGAGRRTKGKQDMDIPWFNDDFGEDWNFDDVVEAFTIYKDMYGDWSNFTEGEPIFVVPAAELDTDLFVDEESQNFESDASANAAAALAAFEQAGKMSENQALREAEMQLVQFDTAPATVTLPKPEPKKLNEELEWPEHLGGMNLGNLIRRIRDGSLEVGHLPERRAALDALDFDWGDTRRFLQVPFEKALCAFCAYYLIRGDMFVWDNFVIPDDDPWPEALAGIEVGKLCHRVRELQNFFEEYHPEKVMVLRSIEFVWFPSLALPLDPDEPPMDNEQLSLSVFGHPDFHTMARIKAELIDKLTEDGPFMKATKTSEWWRQYHDWEYLKEYWYNMGCRDNAFRLRVAGYPRCADEHEAKYGPGMYKQINWLLEEVAKDRNQYNDDERLEKTEKLLHYRDELEGSSDLSYREITNYFRRIDRSIENLNEDQKSTEAQLEDEGVVEDGLEEEMVDETAEEEFEEVEEEVEEDVEYEYVEEGDESAEDEDVEYEYEYDYEEEEEVVEEEDEDDVDEIDVEDELGLGDTED